MWYRYLSTVHKTDKNVKVFFSAGKTKRPIQFDFFYAFFHAVLVSANISYVVGGGVVQVD